jgi:hypothetical protein
MMMGFTDGSKQEFEMLLVSIAIDFIPAPTQIFEVDVTFQ